MIPPFTPMLIVASIKIPSSAHTFEMLTLVASDEEGSDGHRNMPRRAI